MNDGHDKNSAVAADLAERAVVGAMLRDPAIISDVAAVVMADDFRHDVHQRLFRILCEMADSRSVIDLVGVANELNRRGQVADVGGYDRLAELFDAAPTAANAFHHARLVFDQSTLRRLCHVGVQIVAAAESPSGPVDLVVEQAERSVLAVADRGITDMGHDAAEVVNSVVRRAELRMQGGRLAAGIPTGFLSIDSILGGLRKGELIVPAARPSVGKTAFVTQIVTRAALVEAVPVLFVSLEMGREEIFERMLCAMGSVGTTQSQRGRLTDEEAGRFAEAAERLRRAPLRIVDRPNQRVLQIAAAARRMKKRQGLGLVAIDYLQLIEPDNRRDPRHEQVGQVSRRLKLLARELDVPVLAAAQVNRTAENRKGERPRLADLRESGSIEQDADVVLLLHRPNDQADEVEVIVAKQRNGPIGEATLRFRRPLARFDDPGDDPPFG